MDFIYMVRHHSTVEIDENKDGAVVQERIEEFAFVDHGKAYTYAVNLCMKILGLDPDNMESLEEVKMFKHFSSLLKPERGIGYKSLEIPIPSVSDSDKDQKSEMVELQQIEIIN